MRAFLEGTSVKMRAAAAGEGSMGCKRSSGCWHFVGRMETDVCVSVYLSASLSGLPVPSIPEGPLMLLCTRSSDTLMYTHVDMP